jgi:hypothetical protein
MEDKLFTLLGLGVPFYLGAATYAVFAWLDSNASDEATKVISSWLHGRSQNKPDLGNRLCCKDDRRRWEDGDKLDPISFMRRYRKER